MKLRGGAAVVALGALAVTEGFYVGRSFLSLVPDETTEPRTLQYKLDQECEAMSTELCENGDSSYCKQPTTRARFTKGATLKDHAFRCYPESSIDFATVGLQCINNCGELSHCYGTVKNSATGYLDRPDELKRALDGNLDVYCKLLTRKLILIAGRSNLQIMLDAYCIDLFAQRYKDGHGENYHQPVVARFGKSKNRPIELHWRCYAVPSLDLDVVQKGCTDDCGNLVFCPGGTSPTTDIFVTHEPELNTLRYKYKGVTCEMNAYMGYSRRE